MNDLEERLQRAVRHFWMTRRGRRVSREKILVDAIGEHGPPSPVAHKWTVL